MYDLYTKSRASLNGRRCDANVMGRNTNEMRNIQALVLALIRWCGREDLNLHTLTGTCTSSMRVRQFPPRPQNRTPCTSSNTLPQANAAADRCRTMVKTHGSATLPDAVSAVVTPNSSTWTSQFEGSRIINLKNSNGT